MIKASRILGWSATTTRIRPDEMEGAWCQGIQRLRPILVAEIRLLEGELSGTPQIDPEDNFG